MVLFFARRLLERRLHVRIARRERLPLVERLGADLTHVVHPHECRGMGAGARIELAFGLLLSR